MRPKKKNSSKKPLAVGVGIAVGVVAVLWIPVLRPAYQHYSARRDVAALVEAVQTFIKIEGESPGSDAATICRLLRGETVKGLNSRKLDYVESYSLNEKGEFVDPWGMAYRFSVERKPRVYSCGPNKTDEQGQGDDIVAE